MTRQEIKEILNMSEEKRKELYSKGIKNMYENYSDNEINRDVTQNAIKYLRETCMQFENYTDDEIKLFLFGIGKVSEN